MNFYSTTTNMLEMACTRLGVAVCLTAALSLHGGSYGLESNALATQGPHCMFVVLKFQDLASIPTSLVQLGIVQMETLLFLLLCKVSACAPGLLKPLFMV